MSFVLDTFDLTPITSAIHGSGTGYEFDYEMAADYVLRAAEKWLDSDSAHYRVVRVEQKFERPLTVGGRTVVVSGIADLVLDHIETGRLVAIDWKTTLNQTITDSWRTRYEKSWQGRLYCLEAGATAYEYRGIAEKQVGQVRGSVDETDGIWVVNQIRGVVAQMVALEAFPVWTQHRPDACGAFGRTCPFDTICAERANELHTLDGTTVSLPPVDRVSFSDIEAFMRCPERWRLSELAAVGQEEDKTALEFGSAVHRGLAALYEQVKERQK
jgi:hypothetical protein